MRLHSHFTFEHLGECNLNTRGGKSRAQRGKEACSFRVALGKVGAVANIATQPADPL
jgi:hypothetical protein